MILDVTVFDNISVKPFGLKFHLKENGEYPK